MKYENSFLAQAFGLTFLTIVASGILLSFSVQAAFIGLCVAFGMNFCLFAACAIGAFKNEVPVDQDVHP